MAPDQMASSEASLSGSTLLLLNMIYAYLGSAGQRLNYSLKLHAKDQIQMNIKTHYCKFGNIRENFISRNFAKI